MDETMKNTTTEKLEESAQPENKDDALNEAIEAQLRKTRRQNLLIGAQTMCSVILQKITVAMNKPGKRTLADYKRLTKDIEQFCRTGVSRKINADGEVELVEDEPAAEPAAEETVQN